MLPLNLFICDIIFRKSQTSDKRIVLSVTARETFSRTRAASTYTFDLFSGIRSKRDFKKSLLFPKTLTSWFQVFRFKIGFWENNFETNLGDSGMVTDDEMHNTKCSLRNVSKIMLK